MIPFFKNKNKGKNDFGSVGLDIGSSSLKLVKLKFVKGSPKLSGFALEPAKEDLLPQVKALAQSNGIERVNLSVSGAPTIIRYINLPRMSEEELRQAIKFEAQKHIPFSINEVNVDAVILNPELPENKMLVLLAAVKKDLMSQRMKLMEDAGLKVDIIDVDSLALINAFNFNYSQDPTFKSQTLALLNIGSSYSNLNILEDGVPRLSRDIHIGSEKFTQKIVENLGVDLKLAEDLKLDPEKDKEKQDKVRQAIESVLTGLAGEISTSFDYYESQSAAVVSKVWLSGGGSLSKGLKEALFNIAGVKVEYWDPLKNIEIADGVDAPKIKSLSSAFGIAIGLALRQQ